VDVFTVIMGLKTTQVGKSLRPLAVRDQDPPLLRVRDTLLGD
jgi:hypothetical protein